MNTPRLEPLAADRWDDAARDAVSPLLSEERRNPPGAGNVVATLARHPGLTRAYLTFNAHLLLASTLTPRIREVALLRAVHVRPCDYLWDHHLPIAHGAGLTDAEIASIRSGDPDDAVDRLVVRAVDELHGSNTLSDDTWTALTDHFDERQVLDLIFTIGCYQMLGAAVNALGIQPETH